MANRSQKLHMEILSTWYCLTQFKENTSPLLKPECLMVQLYDLSSLHQN